MKNKTGVMFGRIMKHVWRSPDTIITVALMPIAMMLMFVYVFGGAIQSALPAGAGNYVTYQLPGILLITVASGIAYTAYRLFMDVQKGIFERFNAMPISRSSALLGHVLTSMVSIFISLLLVVVVALVMGFRSSAGVLEWLGVIGILALFTLGFTLIAASAGLTAQTVDGASAFSYPLLFLPFLSSAFVPTATMPLVVRVFAEYQPVTPIVNTIRALLAQQSPGNDWWIALLWCAGICVVAYVFAVRTYRRRALAH